MRHLLDFLLIFALCFGVSPVSAQTDGGIEETAMEIADALDCAVCSDPHIEQATDEIAKDLRFFIRAQLRDGKSPELVYHAVLANYENVVREHEAPVQPKDDPAWFGRVMPALAFACMAFYVFRRSRMYKGGERSGAA